MGTKKERKKAFRIQLMRDIVYQIIFQDIESNNRLLDKKIVVKNNLTNTVG